MDIGNTSWWIFIFSFVIVFSQKVKVKENISLRLFFILEKKSDIGMACGKFISILVSSMWRNNEDISKNSILIYLERIIIWWRKV